MKKILLLTLLIAFSILILSYAKKKVRSTQVVSQEKVLHYDNSDTLFALGRALFYDPILSLDSTRACGTCHIQKAAFTDPGARISAGVNNRPGIRNTIQIANLASRRHFFWDGRVNSLDSVSLMAIESPDEMDENIQHVVYKLNRSPNYTSWFAKAFDTDSIEGHQVLHALSEFMLKMESTNSRYDYYIRGNSSALSEKEVEGMDIFKEKCSQCHTMNTFTDESFRNNGLDDIPNDLGREKVTGTATDRGKFLVPSLRNVAITPPYMHDGRFNTLEEVLNHYSQEVKNSSTLDKYLKQNETVGIVLNEKEKMQLISFLYALTDINLVKENRFSNPEESL